MPAAALADAARDALLLALSLSAPAVAAAALVALGPWMGHELGAFAEKMFAVAASP
jgi:type III secretory pathway component EscS